MKSDGCDGGGARLQKHGEEWCLCCGGCGLRKNAESQWLWWRLLKQGKEH